MVSSCLLATWPQRIQHSPIHKPYGFPDGSVRTKYRCHYSLCWSFEFRTSERTPTELNSQSTLLQVIILPWKQWKRSGADNKATNAADASHSSGSRIYRATIRADNKWIPTTTFARIIIIVITTYYTLSCDVARPTHVSSSTNNASDSTNSAIRGI